MYEPLLNGLIGLGDKKDRIQAERIAGLNRVKLIAAGDQHSAAVTEGGGLYVWGASPHGHEDVLAPVMFAKDCATLTKLELSKDRLVAMSAGVRKIAYFLLPIEWRLTI
jgi:alpha-tubulin suppressor-like RCC1 family protein